MSAIGYASLPITVSLRGMNAAIKKHLEDPVNSAATKAGKRIQTELTLGIDGSAKAFEQAKRREAQAQEKVNQAMQKTEQAQAKVETSTKRLEAAEKSLESVRVSQNAKVQDAESKLQTLRESSTATTEQLESAERKLEAARANQDAKIAQAEAKVSAARQQQLGSVSALEGAETALSNARGRASDAADNVAAAQRRMADASDVGSAKMQSLGATFDSVAGQGAGLFGQLGKVSGLLAAGLGLAGGVGFLSEAIKEGREFDGVLGSLGAVTGSTAEQLAKVKQHAKDLGNDESLAGTSAASAADAMLALAKGGMDVSQAMDAAKGSIQLAGAAQISAGDAADLQVAALNSFHLAADQATRVADVLANTANNTATTVTDLGEALKMAAPTAATLGVSLEDTNTYIGLFANQGVKGTMAGTAMRSALLSLTSPSKQAAKALENMGIQAFDADGKFVGLREITIQLHDAQERMGESAFLAEASTAFGREAVSFATTAASSGVEAFDNLRGKMDAVGTAGETAGAKLGGLNGAMERWDNALSDAKLRIYEVIAPHLEVWMDQLGKSVGSVAEAFSKTVEWIRQHNELVGTIAAMIGGVIGAYTMLKAVQAGVWAVGAIRNFIVLLQAMPALLAAQRAGTLAATAANLGLTGSFTGLNAVMAMNPFIALGLAIAAVVAGLVYFFTQTETGKRLWGEFTDFLKNAWEGVKEGLANIGQWFSEKWQAATEGLSSLKDKVTNTFNELAGPVKDFAGNVGTWLSEGWENLKTGAGVFKDIIGDAISKGWENVKDIFSASIDTVKEVFSGFFVALVDIVTGNWEDVPKAFGRMWDHIKDIWGEAGENIKNRFNDFAENVKGKLGAFKDAAVNKIKNMWGDIVQGFHAGVAKVIITVTGWKNQFLTHLAEMISKGLKFAQEFPDKLKNFFAKAGAWLVNAGINIFTGLLNGLREGFAKVMNWLDEKVSAIQDKVSSVASSAFSINTEGSRHANGGIVGYARGGLAFAKGGENHTATIAAPGEWRVWAEPETGGEAYIPLAPAKRARSTAILSRVADIFGMRLQDKATGMPVQPTYTGNIYGGQKFAEGGVTGRDLVRFAQGHSVKGYQASRPLEGAPYVWGGSNWGDCSGAMSAFAALAAGINPFPRKFATGNQGDWGASHGFHRGVGGANTFTMWWFNGGPWGGHTVGKIDYGSGSVFVEMGGQRGNGQLGGMAGANLSQFTDAMFIRLRGGGPQYSAERFEETLDRFDGLPGKIDGITYSPDEGGFTLDSGVATTRSSDSTGSGTPGWGSAAELHKALAKFYGLQETKKGTALTGSGNEYTGSGVAGPKELGDPLTLDPDKDVPYGQQGKKHSGWGHDYFVHEISRRAKDFSLSSKGAMIGVATALVESGDPLKMFANAKVPGSLAFRHDAVGSDHDSVGLFQQRQAGWGTLAERMDPYKSAGLFYKAMLSKFPGWEAMSPGAVAQGVQVSAFPTRYATKMDRALSLVKGTGLYDNGGWLPSGGMAVNLSGKPERVLTHQEFLGLDHLANSIDSLVSKMEPIVERIGSQWEERRADYEGDFLGSAQIVQDAEQGLAETRRQVVDNTKAEKEALEEVEKARKEYQEAEAKGAKVSTASARKIQDAETALARARSSKAKNKAEKIADAEKRLARAREDAAASIDKSDNKNAEEQKKKLEALNKAEDKLAKVRKQNGDALKQIEVAERTVMAARIQAVRDLITAAQTELTSMIGAFALVAGVVSEAHDTVQKTRKEVRKLKYDLTQAMFTATQAAINLRNAEFNLAQVRATGAVNQAKALEALDKARLEANKQMYDQFGFAIDRYIEKGTGAWGTVAGEAQRRTNQVRAAEWELRRVQAENALQQHTAMMQAKDAAFAAAEATLNQAKAAELLKLSTQKLQVQAAKLYGLDTPGLSGAQKGLQGLQKGASGLMGVLGGLVSAGLGFYTGNIATGVGGALTAIKSIGDIFTGFHALKANKDETGKVFKGLSLGKKLSLGLATLLGGAAAAGGAVAGVNGYGVEAATGGAKVGSEIINSAFGTIAENMKTDMERMNLEFQRRQEALQNDYATRLQNIQNEREYNKTAGELRKSELSKLVELASINKQIQEATSKETVEALKHLAEVTEQQRNSELRLHKDTIHDLRLALRQSGAEAEHAAAESERVGNKRATVTVNLPSDKTAYSADEVKALLEQISKSQADLDLRVREIEEEKKPNAWDFQRSLRKAD